MTRCLTVHHSLLFLTLIALLASPLAIYRFDQVIAILEKRAFGDTSAAACAATDSSKEDEMKLASGSAAVEDDTVATNTCHKKKKKLLDYILVDTPGQIESFSWSASGQIFSEALASSFPTVLAFVVDTPRCATSPNTFMSNMLCVLDDVPHPTAARSGV